MTYRDKYFAAHKPFLGKYRCCRCGKWFKKADIDIDHRIPKRKGGTDDLWNLQAMCKHCNRSKGANESKLEVFSTVVRATAHGDLGKVAGGAVKQKAKDVVGIKYKR